MSQFATFEERFDYLSLKGTAFEQTFGLDRYINQRFYRSAEWRNLRHQINVRDEGRDLGIEGYEIAVKPIIHHMNPISMRDFEEGNQDILNPEFLITELTGFKDHLADIVHDTELAGITTCIQCFSQFFDFCSQVLQLAHVYLQTRLTKFDVTVVDMWERHISFIHHTVLDVVKDFMHC